MKYSFLVNFSFGGRGEVHFVCSSHHWDLSSLHFPGSWGFWTIFLGAAWRVGAAFMALKAALCKSVLGAAEF